VKGTSIRPEYVVSFPKPLEEGVFYISKKYKTAAHACCCGCGTKIVTPLRPTEYRLEEHGNLVSLSPSIGNWNHPCQSHYWIRDNAVVWADGMSKADIRRGRQADDAQKNAYLGETAWPWWHRAWAWLKHLFRR
jgi:hypothetical protein